MIKDKVFFGETKTGQIAYKYFLHNSKGMRVVLSDFGALVLSIEIPDANGLLRDVALGFEKIEDYYCTETGMGAYIGRNANRIKDAKVRINGEKGKYGCVYKKMQESVLKHSFIRIRAMMGDSQALYWQQEKFLNPEQYINLKLLEPPVN